MKKSLIAFILIFMLVLSGCGMKENDKHGSEDKGSSKSPYHRIVSLMPSNTEILYELGLGKYIVGVSTVDDYPKDVKKAKKQFDALNLNKEELLKAKPDLILAHESQKATANKVLSSLWIPVFSITFSLITLITVLVITSVLSQGYPVRILILSGLMIGALFNSLLYFLILLKPRKLNTIADYLFGGFGDAEYSNVSIIAITFIIALFGIFIILNQLKLLQLGELKGQSLGLNVQLITYIALCIASMITAINVAYVGIIGFIGMVIPQLIRKWQWEQSLGRQLALNILIGGQIMVMADFIGSHILSPVQIPASIIIALIGIPVLFYMLISQSKRLH